MFITFEGCDGSGKTVQAGLLRDRLGERAVLLREPGGTEVGEQIRRILISKENGAMRAQAEALLYAAARAQLTEEKIKPALKQGLTIICDRFIDSSVAYQCFGRGLPRDFIERINSFSAPEPDVTFFLDLPPEKSMLRMKESGLDRIELADAEFHRRVYAGYKALAAAGGRFVVVDASRERDEIHEEIMKTLVYI
ncbi:MAG: dTMP kinase [Clostridiales bacterium]|jgi:dTMP kinase|nr:dTMP kinase [Clostridiales bacterium]